MSFITSPGVVGFSNQINTTAPNQGVPVSYFIGSGSAANVDVAFGPKGQGSILAQIPDNTVFGGNKRGQFAVDFQMIRGSALNVASGNQSVLCGGNSNTASGAGSFVGSGNTNVANQTNSVVVGGANNFASGVQSFVGGGSGSTASGTSASVIGGNNNLANGDYSTTAGNGASSRGVQGAFARSAGVVAARGDAQECEYQGCGETNNAVPGKLTTGGLAATSITNTVALAAKECIAFAYWIIGTDDVDQFVVKIEGVAKRGAGAGSTVILGAPTTTILVQTAGALTWAIALAANAALDTLEVTVTGVAATTIRWGYTAKCKEVLAS